MPLARYSDRSKQFMAIIYPRPQESMIRVIRVRGCHNAHTTRCRALFPKLWNRVRSHVSSELRRIRVRSHVSSELRRIRA